MIIYRVEGPGGTGPYSEPLRIYGLGNAHSDSRHPTPWDDDEDLWGWSAYDKYGLQYGGFDSMDKLHAWFDGWQEQLGEWGYVIRSFDCPEGSYKASELQAVFDRDASQALETVPW